MRVGVTGHRGLTGVLARETRAGLAQAAAEYDPASLVAVSCAADGPDTWWADEVLARGGRVEIVLPASRYRDALPPWHRPDLDRLLAAAVAVHHTGLAGPADEAFMAGGELVVALADELVAVWDGFPARGLGGTGDVVARARRAGVPVRVIWPDGAVRDRRPAGRT